MAVRIDPPDVQRARSLAIQTAHAEWVAEQLAAGVDGPTPADRPEPSDYNQHVPILEADGRAQDAFFERVTHHIAVESTP